MWLGGVLVLLAAVVTAASLVGRTLRNAACSPVWDIPAVASTYTGIVGALAGFSVASMVFLATRTSAARTESFGVTMGWFLAAFICFLFPL